MKIPVIPPQETELLDELYSRSPDLDELSKIHQVGPVDDKKRYLHWEKLKYLSPPYDLTSKQWWLGIKLSRKAILQTLPFRDSEDDHFSYCVPGHFQQELHHFDLNTAGNMIGNSHLATPNTRTTFLIRSLVEEAINSSQLEGASTTRRVAKEMIRQGREPKDKSEQMILNNFHAMQLIQEIRDEKLTIAMVKELHKIVTEKTLEDPLKAGEFRSDEDNVDVVDNFGQVLHVPPPADQLQRRVDTLCKFANGELGKEFVHPVVRAIVLHFMLAYDHPFVDGNGRTARALFYWSMAAQNYWLMEYISISKIIKKAPVQYGKAFLYTETDDNDVTYFIEHQIDVIRKAIEELHHYLQKKTQDANHAEALLTANEKLKGRLNFRQKALLRHALKHPNFLYRVYEHQNSHGIAYETARNDLIKMSDELNLLTKLKTGKQMVFLSPHDLEERIKSH